MSWTISGQASWQSEWMKVSAITWPRYRASAIRCPYWSVSEKFAARRPAGSAGPSNALAGAVTLWPCGPSKSTKQNAATSATSRTSRKR